MLAIMWKQELQVNNSWFREENITLEAKISDWIMQNPREAYFFIFENPSAW